MEEQTYIEERKYIIKAKDLQELNLKRNDDGKTFTLQIKSKPPIKDAKTEIFTSKRLELDDSTSIKVNKRTEQSTENCGTGYICQIIKVDFCSSIKGKLCSYETNENHNRIYAEMKEIK